MTINYDSNGISLDPDIFAASKGYQAKTAAITQLAERETLQKLKAIQDYSDMMRAEMAKEGLIIVRDARIQIFHLLYYGTFVLTWDAENAIHQAHVGPWIDSIEQLYDQRLQTIANLAKKVALQPPADLTTEIALLLETKFCPFKELM